MHEPPTPFKAAWQARSAAAIWHPCTQVRRLQAVPPLPIAGGLGSWLYDHEGQRCFDTLSSCWVDLFGHADPALKDAVEARLDRLPLAMLAGCTHAPTVELAECLSAHTSAVVDHGFYASHGTSGVEIALKMSFHDWRTRGLPGIREFISLRQSDHGATLGALSVTALLDERRAQIAAVVTEPRGAVRRRHGDARSALPARGAPSVRPARCRPHRQRDRGGFRPHWRPGRLRADPHSRPAAGRVARPDVPLTVDGVYPVLLRTPCAPHLAADIKGRTIDRRMLHDSARRLGERVEALVIGGVDGSYVPLALPHADAPGFGTTDLACDSGLPVVRVVALHLGCLMAQRFDAARLGIIPHLPPTSGAAGPVPRQARRARCRGSAPSGCHCPPHRPPAGFKETP